MKKKGWVFMKIRKVLLVLCVIAISLLILPVDNTKADESENNLTAHSGQYLLKGELEGSSTNWAYVLQWVGGITANTDYTAGIWIKGDGAVTLKILNSNWSTYTYKRIQATNEWNYVTLNFNSGNLSGSIAFAIYDDSGTTGTVYLDDAYLGENADGLNKLNNSDFESLQTNWSGNWKNVFTILEAVQSGGTPTPTPTPTVTPTVTPTPTPTVTPTQDSNSITDSDSNRAN